MRRPDLSGRLPPRERGPRPLLAAGGLLCLALAAAPAGPRTTALVAGLRLEERLAGGESRRYPIALAAGDFLGAAVTEKGIDVEVRLLAPGGESVARVDTPTDLKTDREGEEELAAVAPRGGAYRLEVRSTDRGKPAGRYVLRIADLRPAGRRDRRRAEAVRVTQAADDQIQPADSAGWRRQLATRRRSLALWRALGDGRRSAIELYRIGQLHLNLAEPQLASQPLHQAVAGFRTAGDRVGLAAALNETGRADRKLWRLAEAVAHFREALPLAGAEAELQANLLDNLGNAYSDLGRPREAVESIARARELARRVGDPEIEARVVENLGSAYADLGERQRALACYRQALEIAQRAGEPAQQAAAWNNLGDTHEVLGQWDEALAEHGRALALFQAHGDHRNEARSLNHRARIELHLARYDEAAKDLARAIAIGRGSADPALEAAALTTLAFVDLARRQPARARADAEASRRVAPARSEAEVNAWLALGAARRAGGDRRGAGAALARARDLAHARGSGTDEAAATLLLAETARDGGDLPRAAELARRAIEIWESLRTRVASHDLRSSFRASIQSVYELAIDTEMALERARPGQGHAARALTLAERARARSLLEILAAARAAPRQPADPRLAARERRARAEVSAAELARVELLDGDPPPGAAAVAAAGGRFEAALATYEQIARELADESPSYASLIEPQPLAAGEIERRVLDSRTLLLEFALGERRSFLWVVSDTALGSYELPPRAVVEAAARRFYDLVTARNGSPPGETPDARRARLDLAARRLPAAAAALSRLLLGPAAARLGRRRLAVVADGLLQYVPFAALPDPADRGAPLVAAHEVVVLPSASTLAVQRRELAGRRPAPRLLAMLANPVFGHDDPRVRRLPLAPPLRASLHPGVRGSTGGDCSGAETFPPLHFSRQEADSILSLVPAGDRLVATDFAASRAAVLSGRLADYRIIHFATHGCIDSRHPDLSSLVLSLVDRQGLPQDGFLRLADIYQLELHADLVVLSACRTALGQEMRGEGLIGLTRGFMHAGAARVLASLWSVDDRATAELMRRFYRGMLVEKRTPAAALRAAQLAMSRQAGWSSPYYWAGFSLEGEWQ